MEVRYTDVGEFTMLAGSGEDTLAPYGGTLGTRTTFNGGVGQNMVLRYSEDGYALWTITGADAGSLSFPGYGTVDFTACGNLWGGMANDLFLFQEGGSISGFVDGGGGTHNMLDYSGKQGGVYVLMPYGAASYVGWFQNIQDAAGGQGNNLLVGDHHDNQLYGNDGRDVLIGNWGSDSLAGGPGEDLVIGGVTDYDYDPYALFVIAEVWSWNYDYATRIYLLTAGFEGIPVLNTDTVHDDYAVNELAGNGGLDWFFASYADVIQDLEPSERVDYVY
jgi:Ca2+-binding RTX toxin-like protein